MSAERGIRIAPERPDQGAVRCMLAESDRYHAALYPAESNHLVDESELAAAGTAFLVARCDGVLAGFGALIERADADGAYGELKRMYVSPSVRGLGIGRRLLEALEAEARARDLPRLRLETGTKQPEALGLYRAAGFVECEPFGDYAADPNSLFFEKTVG